MVYLNFGDNHKRMLQILFRSRKFPSSKYYWEPKASLMDDSDNIWHILLLSYETSILGDRRVSIVRKYDKSKNRFLSSKKLEGTVTGLEYFDEKYLVTTSIYHCTTDDLRCEIDIFHSTLSSKFIKKIASTYSIQIKEKIKDNDEITTHSSYIYKDSDNSKLDILINVNGYQDQNINLLHRHKSVVLKKFGKKNLSELIGLKEANVLSKDFVFCLCYVNSNFIFIDMKKKNLLCDTLIAILWRTEN